MVVVVLAVEVVDVRGPDQGAAHLARDLDDPLVRLVLLGDPVALELEVDLLGAEDLDAGRRCARGRPSGRSSTMRRQKRDCRQPVSAITPSEWRESSSMSRFGLPREKPSRKPAELSLTRFLKPASLRGHQGQVVALVAGHPLDGLAVVDQVGLDPEDRLDADLLARLVVLDRAVHHAVVGQPEGGHVELGGALGQGLAADRLAPSCSSFAGLSLQAPSSSEYSLWTCRCATPAALTKRSCQPGQMQPSRHGGVRTGSLRYFG